MKSKLFPLSNNATINFIEDLLFKLSQDLTAAGFSMEGELKFGVIEGMPAAKDIDPENDTFKIGFVRATTVYSKEKPESQLLKK